MNSLRARLAPLVRSPWLKLALQVLVSLALIAVLLSLDLPSLVELLRGSDPLLVLVVVILTFVYTYLLSERWRLILRGLGVHQATLTTFDLSMRGYFFGTFLPSNAGGDVVKAYLLSRRGAPLSVALLSVVLDRVTGMAALLWLGALAGWFTVGPSEVVAQVSSLALVGLAIVVTVSGLLGLWLVPMLERPLLALTPRFARPAMNALLGAMREFAARPMLFLVATIISIPLQIFYVFQMHLLVLALHAHVDLGLLTLAVTWGTLAGALPISFSGFGPRETAFVATLGSPQVGLAVGLLSGALQIISGIPGGILQLLDRGSVPPKTDS